MLSITDLTAGYGKLTILHGITLALPAGQFAAILGPNGSGKSTLLKTIVGLTTIERGALTHQTADLHLREAGRYALKPLNTQALRDLVEQGIDRVGADRLQHVLHVGCSVRYERHGLGLCARKHCSVGLGRE